MKTTQIISLTLLAGIMMFTACTKEENEFAPQNSTNTEFKTSKPNTPAIILKNWTDQFTTAASLTENWTLTGTPQPLWVNFACGKFGVFDNNGQLPEGAFAISKTKVGSPEGYTVEASVCIDLKNPSSTVISPMIGVSRYALSLQDPPSTEAGISMQLMYVGTGIEGVPVEYQGHTFLVMSALTQKSGISPNNNEDGAFEYSGKYAFMADYAGNGWHKIKIVVNASHRIAFYLDNELVWSPKANVHSSLLKGKNVLMGYISPGHSGKAYHDYVKVTYPINQEENSVSNDLTN